MNELEENIAARISNIYEGIEHALQILERSVENSGNVIQTHYDLFNDIYKQVLPYINEQVESYGGILPNYKSAYKIMYVIAGMNLFYGLMHLDDTKENLDGISMKTWKLRAIQPRKRRKNLEKTYNIEHLGTYSRLLGYKGDIKEARTLLDKFSK